jgi:GTP-binding protein EngB required for normal cell division
VPVPEDVLEDVNKFLSYVYKVAFLGYTNAGKSTLMNDLTEDKGFYLNIAQTKETSFRWRLIYKAN